VWSLGSRPDQNFAIHQQIADNPLTTADEVLTAADDILTIADDCKTAAYFIKTSLNLWQLGLSKICK
jgi:hypothetical protein